MTPGPWSRKRRARRCSGALLLAIALFAATTARAGDPRIDYMLQCQGCHLPDGTGLAGSVPSLAGEIGRFLLVPGGRAFLVRVPGSAQSVLDDRALAEVLNWMVREFGPDEVASDFRPYGAEEVARWRSEPLVDVAGVRRELVARIAALERDSK
ncbi:MAG: c-type cytochrome [Myxococcota bacterium]